MKKKIFVLILLIGIVMLTGCGKDFELYSEVTSTVKVTINGENYTLELEDNNTAKSFVTHLPQEFTMDDLNDNEKFIYMDFSLPAYVYSPGHINAGDVMLYGDNCLVIFYKSFDTNYSYTKIGHINDLGDLGNGSVTVKFEK